MIDFPASPTPGQVFTASNGVTYVFNNGAWTTALTLGLPDAPSDDALYGRKDAAWAKAVKLGGDTMTGSLSIAPAAGQALFTLTGIAGQQKQIFFQTGGLNRWAVLASNTAEAGADAGSDFIITRCNDAGVSLATALQITRATGQVRIPASGTNAAPSF